MIPLYPGERHRFTWEVWETDPFPHILGVETEN